MFQPPEADLRSAVCLRRKMIVLGCLFFLLLFVRLRGTTSPFLSFFSSLLSRLALPCSAIAAPTIPMKQDTVGAHDHEVSLELVLTLCKNHWPRDGRPVKHGIADR